MNAHTPIVADTREARTLVDQLEGDLDRIASLATATCIIIEQEMGTAHPAKELFALVTFIEETARSAEAKREAAFHALHGAVLSRPKPRLLTPEA